MLLMILLSRKKVNNEWMIDLINVSERFDLVVYGINTGFGSFASTIIPDEKLA